MVRVYEMENNDSCGSANENGVEIARFSVLYAKASTRKHKKWEGDGILLCYSKVALLKSEDEREVISRSTSVKRVDELDDGKVIMMGSWEVQIQNRLWNTVPSTSTKVAPFHQHLPSSTQNPVSSLVKPTFKRSSESAQVYEPPIKRVVSASATKGFTSPVIGFINEQNAPPFVVNSFAVEAGELPVVAESNLSRHLRDHQKEGVSFIYRSLQPRGGGAILADDMGLGKSIQAITATWTLMSRQAKSLGISKCLIVVPSSLVNNWKAEFKKWFRGCKIPVMCVMRHGDIRSYSHSVGYNPYLLISYDMALRYVEKLAEVRFDLIVCDEAHRMKNASGKLRQALYSLDIPRRLLLTGTPLQNDIDEFHSLLDFVLPGQFGSTAEFRKACSDDTMKSTYCELIENTMLRRSSEVNKSHLPEKQDYVLFCAPSDIQRQVAKGLVDFMSADALVIIDMMRKLSNHPAILYKKLSDTSRESYEKLLPVLNFFPKNYGNCAASLSQSGKLSVLSEMLGSFRKLGECCVIVSNYTKTLDMLAGMCSSLVLNVYRLDGTVPVADRQKLVNDFNEQRDPANVFLLSTKAGGVGLNLVAASRLVMFDSDWNPANDLQAMARIWRDGQTRPCHIYRLATAGTIDEKILQRQIKKTGLGAIIDPEQLSSLGNVKFTDEDLMDIFSYRETACDTHDLLDCHCEGSGLLPVEADEEEGDDDIAGEQPVGADPLEEVDDDSTTGVPEITNEDDAQGPASMAELFRWRHFAPTSSTWPLFLETAGLPSESPTGLSFAFHLSTKF